MKNILSSVLTLATTIGLTAPVQAAIINYDFTVNIDSGSLDGQFYQGSFSFNDVNLIGSGSEFIALEDLSFTFGSTDYTLSDDANAEVEFFNGELLGLSFNVNGIFSFIPGFFNISESSFFYDELQAGGFGDVSYTVQTAEPVPEPISVLSLLAFVGLSFSYKSKKV